MGSILQRYVLSEVLKTFAAALLAFSVVFLIGGLYELIRNGISLRQIFILVPYILIYTLPFLLPVALLVACALAYGRLAADNEIVPVATGGIPITALAVPALLLGIVLSALLYGLEGSVVPYGLLKKKDLVRGYIEELTDLGEGEDRPITNHDNFHFFCRRHHGSRIEGAVVVYVPRVGAQDVLVKAPGSEIERARPTEIVARSGRIERDDARDAVVLELEDVTFTQFEAPSAGTRTAEGVTFRGELPERGAPHHGRLARVRIDIPMAGKLVDKTEFRSTAYLRRLDDELVRFERYREAATAPGDGAAGARAALAPLLSLAAARAVPGAPAGAQLLGPAALGAISPSPNAAGGDRELRRQIAGFLHARGTLALAPFLFALVGAAVPLLIQHNNRLVPFFVSFATVTLTYYLPWLAIEAVVDTYDGAPGWLYWGGPVLTAAAGAELWRRLRNR